MIELFDIDAVNKAASSFNTDKLLWLNQHYIKQEDPKRIAHLLSPHMGELDIDPSQGPDLVEVAEAHQERANTLVEMAEMSAFCYRDFDEFEEKAAKKHLRPVAREPLARMREELASLGDWRAETLHSAVDTVAAELDLKMGKVAQPLRVALVGRAASPGIDVTLYLVGKEASLRRIDQALAYIDQREASAG
jgi:glutamyl-tRNA synthetase